MSLRKRLSERTEAAGVSDISTVHTLDRQTDTLDYIPLIVGRVVRREKCNFDSNLFMFRKMLVFTTSLSLQLHSSCFQTPVALGSQGCRVSSSHSPSWCQSSHRVRLASPVRINSASFNFNECDPSMSALLLQYHHRPLVAAQSTIPLKGYAPGW